MNQKDLKSPYSRRDFLKTSSACGLASAASGVMLPLVASPVQAAPGASPKPAPEGKVVWSACTVNCGSRCPLRMHVVDGRIRWVETDNLGQDVYGDHQVRACARGRSMRQRVYNADRLKYPMKRVGKRGEGKFERISWDEAYTLIAKSLQETIAKYGNEAVYINYTTGTLGCVVARCWPPGVSLPARLMNLLGGYLNHYNTYSTAQIRDGLNYTYGGGWAMGNDTSDIANTKLYVCFGENPDERRWRCVPSGRSPSALECACRGH